MTRCHNFKLRHKMSFFLNIFVKELFFMRQKTCHSGGAEGADLYFEQMALIYHCAVVHYSYKTPHHESDFKYELTFEEYQEGLQQVEIVAKQLKRFRYKPYSKYLARNFFQIKNATQVFAIACLEKDAMGVWRQVQGGTGWAVQMGINHCREIFVFDQKMAQWYSWDYTTHRFVMCTSPKITALDFAGIGTRKLNMFGKQAIEQLFKNSLE